VVSHHPEMKETGVCRRLL